MTRRAYTAPEAELVIAGANLPLVVWRPTQGRFAGRQIVARVKFIHAATSATWLCVAWGERRISRFSPHAIGYEFHRVALRSECEVIWGRLGEAR